MALLGHSAFLKALGWALLNSIWQMGLLWLVFIFATVVFRNLTPRIKHSLSLILLGTGFFWFAFTLVLQYFRFSESPEIVFVSSENNPETFSSYIGLSQWLENSLPYLSVVYLGITLFLFFRFAGQYRYTKFVCSHEIQKPAVDIRLFVNQVAERMGIKKNIRVWISNLVDTPMTIGFWKPIILMPIASVNNLTTQQVEAILLHELAHIKRNDYLANLMIASVGIILFFNPFARLFVQSIRKEREYCCDDLVLQFEYNAHAYASALLNIERGRTRTFSLAMAATGRNSQLLLERVKRILNQPPTFTYGNQLAAQAFGLLLIGFIAWSNPAHVIVQKVFNQEPPSMAVSNENDAIIQSNVFSAPINLVKKISLKPVVQDNSEISETNVSDKRTLAQLAYDNNQPVTYQWSTVKNIFTDTKILRDYSIAEPTAPPEVPVSYVTPYVPSVSFYYQIPSDSTTPETKKNISKPELPNQNLQQTLKAIEAIDWNTIQKNLTAHGQKLDVKKLQAELKKSIRSLNWQRIEAETRLEELEEEIKLNDIKAYNELVQAAQENNNQMGEHYQNLQKKIIEDQLKCQEETKKKERELKEYLKIKNVKVKKVVVI